MSYRSNEELPDSISKHLPIHAQDIYRKSFNNALLTYGKKDIAAKVAWNAVKQKYIKVNEYWIQKK